MNHHTDLANQGNLTSHEFKTSESLIDYMLFYVPFERILLRHMETSVHLMRKK